MKNKLIISNLVLSQSLTALLLIFACIYWFPHSLSQFVDFVFHSKLLILANLILGPLLLMLIYKEGKKGLKLDIAILVVLQISAFGFGAYALYQKHPVYAVFAVDRFTLISAKEARPNRTNFSDLKVNLFSSTKLVYAKMPTDIQEKNDVILQHLSGNKPDLDGRPEYYQPYQKHIASVLARSLDINDIIAKKANHKKLKDFLNKFGGNKKSYAYLPLQNNNQDVIWVLDKSTAQPVGILNIDPWEFYKSTKQKPTKAKTKIRRWLS